MSNHEMRTSPPPLDKAFSKPGRHRMVVSSHTRALEAVSRDPASPERSRVKPGDGTGPTRRPNVSQAAIRLHRRRGPSRWWLKQGIPVMLLINCMLLPASGIASIITGNLQNTSGNPYATNALFAPLSTPLASGNNTIASTSTNVVAAANGSFSVTLKQGNYLVTIGNVRHDSFVISVPNDANTYNLNSVITNALTFNYTYSPTYEQRVNKGQADGYVGLFGTVLNPAGLTASNFNFLGTINLGTDPINSATFYINTTATF